MYRKLRKHTYNITCLCELANVSYSFVVAFFFGVVVFFDLLGVWFSLPVFFFSFEGRRGEIFSSDFCGMVVCRRHQENVALSPPLCLIYLGTQCVSL